MAFYGCDFTFDGVSASSMGLMIYDFGTYGQDDVDLSVGEIVADQISGRYESLLYGLVQNEPLEFTLVFGADPDDVEVGSYLTRERINTISKWLTGHRVWKQFYVHQDDMGSVVTSTLDGQTHSTWSPTFYYRCMVTGLKVLTDGTYPWAFSCHITCDSPFAYRASSITSATLNGSTTLLSIENTSVLNGYYYPIITVRNNTSSSLTITNNTDGGRICSLTGMPTNTQNITMDCKDGILTSSAGFNLYQYFNFNFLRLVSGVNSLTAIGNGTLSIQCDFPVNIGA